MSLIPCDRCERRDKGALTQCTWAWYRADQERVAYRQRLCFQCVGELLAPLYQASEDWALVCPCCGIGTADDMDPVYATFFPRGIGKCSMELPTCGPCAAKLRLEAQKGSRKLQDVSGVSGGQVPSPQTDGYPDWDSIGIRPRAEG